MHKLVQFFLRVVIVLSLFSSSGAVYPRLVYANGEYGSCIEEAADHLQEENEPFEQPLEMKSYVTDDAFLTNAELGNRASIIETDVKGEQNDLLLAAMNYVPTGNEYKFFQLELYDPIDQHKRIISTSRYDDATFTVNSEVDIHNGEQMLFTLAFTHNQPVDIVLYDYGLTTPIEEITDLPEDLINAGLLGQRLGIVRGYHYTGNVDLSDQNHPRPGNKSPAQIWYELYSMSGQRKTTLRNEWVYGYTGVNYVIPGIFLSGVVTPVDFISNLFILDGTYETPDGSVQIIQPGKTYVIALRPRYNNYNAYHVFKVQEAPPIEPEQESQTVRLDELANGKEYLLSLRSLELIDLASKTLVLEYDPQKLSLLDFAAQVPGIATSVGNISDTMMTITAIEPGKVTFRIDDDVPLDQGWSGILTVVKLLGIASGDTEVTLTLLETP